MHEIFALNDRTPPAIAVHELWVVDADPSYPRHERRPPRSTRLLFLRTRAGCGRIRLAGQKETDLPPDSLLVCPLHDVTMYTCGADHWDFMWCVFSAAFPEPIRMGEVVQHPGAAADVEAACRAVAHFAEDSPEGLLLGTAAFLTILGRCLPALSLPRQDADTLAVRTDTLLRSSLTSPLTASDIAGRMGVSERTLRRVFTAEFGITPIGRLRTLRLEAAARWVRGSTLSLEQIAEMYCFSSAFHFSRAYKAAFGIPPGQDRQQADP